MAGIDELSMYTDRKGFSPGNIFKKLVADGSIKFNFGVVAIDIKDDDAKRVHDIVHAINDRRAFYNSFDDEVPERVARSVMDTKKDIYETSKGLWRNPWSRDVVQLILHDLGDFLTKVERKPLPKISDKKEFEEFLKHLLDLRIRIWTAVAHFVVVYGDAVSAYHMPKEILAKVTLAYLDTTQHKKKK
jgi:hypothetical protein